MPGKKPQKTGGSLLESLQDLSAEERKELLLERDERVSHLRKENTQLQRRLAKASVSSEIVIDELRGYFADKSIIVDVPPTPPKQKGKKNLNTEIPVFVLGDWHLGDFAPNGPYAYSVAIGKERVHLAVDKFIATVRDRRNSANIDELRLYILGDLVEGEAMRQGHAHHIEGPVIQQACTWAPEVLSSAIIRLLGEFRKVKIIAIPGNHGRNGPARGDAAPETNWDRVCYEVTRHVVTNALLQSNPKRLRHIEWDLPSDRAELRGGDDWYSVDYVFNWCNCILHGEDLRGRSWGGIPFYGVERLIQKYANVVHDPIDFMYMGHIHVAANIPSNYREVFVNGAVQSSSRYARKQCVSSSPPSQSAVFYTEEHGPISRHTFYLDDRCPLGVKTTRAIECHNAL